MCLFNHAINWKLKTFYVLMKMGHLKGYNFETIIAGVTNISSVLQHLSLYCLQFTDFMPQLQVQGFPPATCCNHYN